MSRVKFDNLTEALDRLDKDIKKAGPYTMLSFSSEFVRDANEDYIAHESGDLKASGVNTPRYMMKQGTIRWKTPYAVKRYYENFKTPHSVRWDKKTWNKNKEKYEKQIAKIYDNEIFK